MTPDPGKADPGSSTAAESTQPINTIVDTTSPPELFRGAEVLKEVFLAIREETFDIALDRIEIWKGETFHLFDPVEGASHTKPGKVALPGYLKIKSTVPSHRGGSHALSGMMFKLGKDVLTGTLTPELQLMRSTANFCGIRLLYQN